MTVPNRAHRAEADSLEHFLADYTADEATFSLSKGDTPLLRAMLIPDLTARYGIAERLLDDGAGASVALAPDSLRAFIDGHQRFKVPPGHACLHETRDRSAQTTRQGIRKCSGPMRSRMRTCEPSRSGTSDSSTLAPAR